MPSGFSTQDVQNWLRDAPPQDIVTIGKQTMEQISGLNQSYKDQFVESVRHNEKITQLLSPVTTG